MIRIRKPDEAPEILRVQGARRRATHCRSFTLHETDYRDGGRIFAFDNSIYGHETVKQALIAAQYGKCAFCERKVGEEGDIEHFRPKAASCQDENSPLQRPGYYWLAYDWDNLLLACGPCNQRNKKNYFPLADPTKRVLSHRGNIVEERPLFLNPAKDDPEQHIGFRQEIAFPCEGSGQGEHTITALGLNRPVLQEARRDHLAKLKTLKLLLGQEHTLNQTDEGRTLLALAHSHLQYALQDIAEFSAMTRAAYNDNFAAPLL